LPALRKGLWGLLASGFLLAPHRHVAIDVVEPDDLPRAADRVVLNRYLEDFYNRNAAGSTYVPYSLWEGGGVRWLPEPVSGSEPGVARRIPPATRDTVLEHLRRITGVQEIHESQRLAHDLGLDSLVRVEIQAWIESEFGFPQPEVDAIETVGDVMRAAVGETVGKAAAEPQPVAHTWSAAAQDATLPPSMPAGDSLTGVFLEMARRHPRQVVIADQQSGVRSYRDLITALLLLRPVFARMPGPYVGIMLPASVAADLASLAALFAGKTPVMINWTTGPRGVLHGLDALDIRCVVTARRLLSRLESEGFGSTPGFLQRLVYLEDVAKQFSLPGKLLAAARARLGLIGPLEEARAPEVAAVLFTSGSESVPKAVPLTQTNLLANIRDALAVIRLRPDEALLGILPPFHSFGLTVDMLLPLLCGLRTVYHVNPNDGATLASLIEAYRTTLVVGTPTFLAGIVRAAQPGQLASLRLAIAGAEKCPPHVYDALARACPEMIVIEGYGITECSPIVSVNRPERPRRETIGLPLPSVEHAIVDAECGKPTPCGQRGMLLVRGPSIFRGYLKYDGPSPFVSFAGKEWYRTGDLVCEDTDGILTFCGRLKRFVKIGGEMIPLAAVEAALEAKCMSTDRNQGPLLAVECTPDEEHPELVLFTTLDIDRETANRCLREAGLSPLHNIRRVVRLEALPVLGTGKADYRALKATLK
jgi:long-chain-fatty-acid--[acyl-carrier-protein] ligase